MTEDDQLMVRIQSGDAAAFDELVARYESPLMGFFMRNTRDVQFSEDLTQETLLRVFNQAWDYLPVGRFRGWMYRIGRNLMIDNIRKQSHDALVKAVKSRSSDDDADLMARIAGEVVGPVERAEYNELADLIADLLEEIPEDQRLTFLLHHYAGLTLSEVADAMETSLPTSKSRLRLAREKLQEKLERIGDFAPDSREPAASESRT